MTDRVPGAPGQYTMTVSADEAQKILTGEPVTVTLVRNDQPLVEGTPYNKASVLPDDLAAQICPNATDPTPADALRGLLPKTGGAMTGPLSMATQALTDLREPSADTDAATLKTVKNRGAATLWTNADTSAEFAAQEIAIAGLSGYPLRVVEFSFAANSTYSGRVVTSVVGPNESAHITFASGTAGTIWRSVTPDGEKLAFSDCYVGTDGDTVANTYLVPVAVYGVRGSS